MLGVYALDSIQCIQSELHCVAIRMDDELSKVCDKVIFPKAGTLCNIHSALLKNVKVLMHSLHCLFVIQ